jgi:hypothetical protein
MFEGISLVSQPVGGQPSPVILQTNPTATFAPSANIFNACRFEGDAQVLLGTGKGFNCIFQNIYAEGDWKQGDGGSTQSFTWVNMPAKWASWLSDPRNIATGVLQ